MKYVVSLPVRRKNDEGGFADPAFIRDAVMRAEELGFWGVTAPDHIVAPREWAKSGGGEHWFDPFVLLSFIAPHTTTLRLITHVIVLPYRSPYAVAKAVASLDRLSGGRAVLGAGSGYLREEFDILGVPYEDRGLRTDEYLQAITEVWREDSPSFSGTFTSIADATVAPKPVQQPRPPIWIGGNSMRAVRRAVELGDCWTPFIAEPPDIAKGVARAGELGRRVEVAAPLGHVGRKASRAVRARASEFIEAGADYLKAGFSGAGPVRWMDNLEWFGSEFRLEAPCR